MMVGRVMSVTCVIGGIAVSLGASTGEPFFWPTLIVGLSAAIGGVSWIVHMARPKREANPNHSPVWLSIVALIVIPLILGVGSAYNTIFGVCMKDRSIDNAMIGRGLDELHRRRVSMLNYYREVRQRSDDLMYAPETIKHLVDPDRNYTYQEFKGIDSSTIVLKVRETLDAWLFLTLIGH